MRLVVVVVFNAFFVWWNTFLAICVIIIVRTFRSYVFNTFIIHIYLESFLLMFHKKKWTTMCKYTYPNTWCKILQVLILCATFSISCTIVFTFNILQYLNKTNKPFVTQLIVSFFAVCVFLFILLTRHKHAYKNLQRSINNFFFKFMFNV
jgi:hypothetical protein